MQERQGSSPVLRRRRPPETSLQKSRLKDGAQLREDQTSKSLRSSDDDFDSIDVEQVNEITIVRLKGLFMRIALHIGARDELGTLIDRDRNLRMVFLPRNQDLNQCNVRDVASPKDVCLSMTVN